MSGVRRMSRIGVGFRFPTVRCVDVGVRRQQLLGKTVHADADAIAENLVVGEIARVAGRAGDGNLVDAVELHDAGQVQVAREHRNDPV